jgi:hypothetical protein
VSPLSALQNLAIVVDDPAAARARPASLRSSSRVLAQRQPFSLWSRARIVGKQGDC